MPHTPDPILTKAALLQQPVAHIDITTLNVIPLIHAMQNMAFQSRNLARAAHIYQTMLADPDCTIVLCIAGSLVSSGLKKIFVDLIAHNMVDIIVATGANIVDQDFFEALGFKHYLGNSRLDDTQLQALAVNRIYDTLIAEDSLRICDQTICQIADTLEPRPYSSRAFINEMGHFLSKRAPDCNSVILSAYQKKLPIFVPAFSDCSAGFGLIMHQSKKPDKHTSIDSVKDFRELTHLKMQSKETGLIILGGGTPKNFAQDVVVAAESLGKKTPLHKYAIQITVADERDGALSGSTLREACSWGKVSVAQEQMVFCEATIAFPLISAYAYQMQAGKHRQARKLNAHLR